MPLRKKEEKEGGKRHTHQKEEAYLI